MKFLNIPNIITLLRVILTVLFPIILANQKEVLAISILILAGITDILDGYIARKTKKVSKYGRIFDSFTDLFFILVTSITLLILNYVNLIIVILFIIGYLIRGLGYLKQNKITPSKWSKAVLILIYILLVFSIISQDLFNLLKYPIVAYHIILSIIETSKIYHRKL
ncbi:CDP-alcohol phosphatidyltransferase family protein [Candidatus Woesearchaeota archaeon]|nr:CDP-alcohol phosphatidyltransferase family protein [Candidatus Woesearchaeota archaeon]